MERADVQRAIKSIGQAKSFPKMAKTDRELNSERNRQLDLLDALKRENHLTPQAARKETLTHSPNWKVKKS
jgi:hypothetical protein